MLKQGSDFSSRLAVIRDNRSRDNESRLYLVFKEDFAIEYTLASKGFLLSFKEADGVNDSRLVLNANVQCA